MFFRFKDRGVHKGNPQGKDLGGLGLFEGYFWKSFPCKTPAKNLENATTYLLFFVFCGASSLCAPP